MPVICFHNADEENGYLSNWYPSAFTLKGIDFSSMEQYMMYRKAICFDDDKVAAQILATEDVAEIKALGRLVSGYDENLWNGVRQIVVYEGLLAKFYQNPELKERLKSTGSAVLAEDVYKRQRHCLCYSRKRNLMKEGKNNGIKEESQIKERRSL